MKSSILIIFICFMCSQGLVSQLPEAAIDDAHYKALDYHYTNKDSAYFYYEKAIRLADGQDDLERTLNSLVYLINANSHYYDLKNYRINLQREDSLLLLHGKKVKELSFIGSFKDYLLFDKGNYHYKIKEYATSKKYFQELYAKISAIPEKEKTIEDVEMLSSLYSFLGLIYRHTGKYDLAAYTFNKDIALNLKHKDSLEGWETGIMNSKKLLSQVLEVKKEYSKANVLLKEALSFYKTKTNDISYKNNFLSSYMFLAKNYIKQNKFKQAIQILKENALFYKEYNPFIKEVYAIYGDAYLGLKEYQQAEKYYQKSLLESTTIHTNEKHQDVAKAYAKLGNLYMQQQALEKGLRNFQLALIQLEKEFENTDIKTNPNAKKASSKTVLIPILKKKQEALFSAYENTKNQEYLENAHETSKAIIRTLDELRPEFDSKIDKQFLITETYPAIQKMVQIAYELYKNTDNINYVEDAFYFMEKSKSILLLEAHRNSEATKYGSVPETIINREQQFRANISHIEQEIFEVESENTSLINSLYALKKEYSDYLVTIEKEYPKYYALKYNSDVVSLSTVQEQLHKNQALLSYLVAEGNLYLTLVDSEKKAFYKLPFNEGVKNTIQRLYRKSSKLDIKDATIYNDSYNIYQSIIASALQKTTATDLVIIPDDILNYISFDALTTSNKEQSYLLESYSISYASSATILEEQNKTQLQNKNRLLVFAPQFTDGFIAVDQERAEMSPLLYNKQEAENIANYFNATVYSENKATINNFIEEVENYNIIHFATHASANDEFPDYSYLAFSNDSSTTSNLLYVKDLYNYQINADLVTLSACQTGIGRLQEGEGMLSLARAFNYAGTSAIVTTLWKINDQSTSEIMSSFYENLSEGLNKKEALRQAKLRYLSANEDPFLRHPYYWSGIVLTGNTIPITAVNYLWWFLLGSIIIILVGIGIKKSLSFYKNKE